jgi:hypothetical protein
MEHIFTETIKKIEESIEQQRLIYEGLLSRAETDEQRESLKELITMSNEINKAVMNKDIKALNEYLNKLSDANKFSKQ